MPLQQLAREFGATEIVTERGDEGVARIKELTNGLGAHSVIEAVGTQESMMQAIRSAREGGASASSASLIVCGAAGEELFSRVQLHRGPAPVRRFLSDLIDLIWNRKIRPGRIFIGWPMMTLSPTSPQSVRTMPVYGSEGAIGGGGHFQADRAMAASSITSTKLPAM